MKRILLNVVLMILAFTVQNCVFPLIPFLTATPNLLLILTFSFGFIYGKEAGLLYGLFAGIFVGCLALAIAEMLDSIPILTRRIGFRHGLGLMVISIAMGKAVGSLLYFWHPIFVFR
mgnify:CR=1 FL=1